MAIPSGMISSFVSPGFKSFKCEKFLSTVASVTIPLSFALFLTIVINE